MRYLSCCKLLKLHKIMWLKSLERHSNKLELIIWISQVNFHTVNIHLQRLIKASLLKSSGSADHLSYRTTAKGIVVLEHINVLRDLLTAVPGSQGRLVVPEGKEDQEQ